jgi:5-methylcytosine-specific restriction endonuclease McrA
MCIDCDGLIPDGSRCDDCRRKRDRQKRKQGYRGAGSNWERTAKAFLRSLPACERCGKRRSAIAHHRVVGMRPSDPGGMDWANLEALCRPCHGQAHSKNGGTRSPRNPASHRT